jgi:uncharacterized protein with ParB-like and HNH nuclease domain
MPVVKLVIDNVHYEVECKQGEESLLKESEELLNEMFEKNSQIKNLSQSKKFLMMSLLLASEVNISKRENEKKTTDFKKIMSELEKLEDIVDKKLDG